MIDGRSAAFMVNEHVYACPFVCSLGSKPAKFLRQLVTDGRALKL
jgi:hypothetical protein